MAPFDHRLQRRKDFLVGQIAGGTEEDKRIPHEERSCRAPRFGGFFQVTAETKAHRGKQPVGVISFTTR